MKKNAFVVFLLTMLMLTGCQKLVARRDESQVVEFANKMPKGEYTLKITGLIIQKHLQTGMLFMKNSAFLCQKW